MTKRELVAAITDLNPTATPSFLAKFQEDDLAQYLEHLTWAAQAATPQGVAVDTPAPADNSPAPVQDELPAPVQDDLPALPTAPAAECEPVTQLSEPASERAPAEPEYQPAATSSDIEEQTQQSVVATMEQDTAPQTNGYASSQEQDDSQTCLF